MPVFYLPNMVPAFIRPVLYQILQLFYLVLSRLISAGLSTLGVACGALLSTSTVILGYRIFRKLKPLLGTNL